MTTQPIKQAFTSLPGLPKRDDPEVNALMRTLLRMTRFEAYEIVRSLFRCALAQERTGDGDYMEVLAEDALMSMRLRADPETAAALEAARSLRPAGPERSVDVREMLAERGLARPKVICLCGPARFAAEWRAAWVRLALAGHTVVGTPDLREELGELPLREQEAAAAAICRAHMKLIDGSDELHIVSRGGYYGDNTRDEIAYALEHGKRVTYLEAPGA